MGDKIRIKDVELMIKNLGAKEALAKINQIEAEYKISLERLRLKYEKKRMKILEERKRYRKMCVFEEDALKKGYKCIAGIDEAGRGPLAGPVVAACVVIPKGTFIEGLNDSKKLSPQKREELYSIILNCALAYGIGTVDEKTIDSINILNAARKAMEEAVSSLKIRPDLLLIDAEKLKNVNIKQIPIVKGDEKSVSIAAASIVAKVTRDRIVKDMDSIYPHYGFSRHKGYGTKEHIEAIKNHGICPIHRRSFTKKFS